MKNDNISQKKIRKPADRVKPTKRKSVPKSKLRNLKSAMSNNNDKKRAEDEIERFASFPKLNPNPVLEVDSEGKVIFCNYAGAQVLREFNLKDPKAFLPDDIKDILNTLKLKNEAQFYREVKIIDRIFGESIQLAPQFNSVRIFANDITERKSYQAALNNALIESRQRGAEISALLDASRSVLKYPDFKDSARAIFDSCKNLIGATSGYVALLSKDGTENEVLFLESGGLPCSVDPELPMPIRGLRAEAYHSLKAVYHNEFLRSKWMEFMPEGHVRLDNVLFAPMVIEGKAVGLLGIANKPGGFTDSDARLASAFADLAAIALTQKHSQEALRHSEEYFRVVTENASDFIAILDADGIIQYESSSVERILGYKPEELVGRSAFDLIHPDDLTNVMDAFSQIIQKPGITLSAEFRCRHKDGSWSILSARGTNLLDDPTVKGIVVNSRDIADRRQAEESLQSERQKLINILDSMVDGVYIVDQKYNIEYVNPEIEKEYGHVNSRSCHEYFEGQNKVCPWCKNKEVFEGKIVRSEWYSEKTNKTYDLINTPLRNPDGSISKLGIFRDITERKQAEESLKKVNRMLRALGNSRQAMIHATTESEFLKEVCEIVVRDCGHAMAWIGFAEDDGDKTVRPVSYAGFEEGYLETLNITWEDVENGWGPTGTAIRTGKPSICRNMLTDPAFEPWRDEAIKRGYASSIVLPLMADGKAFGAINIYSRELDPFTEDEVRLLSELANDLSFGILAMRTRIAHAIAEEAIRQKEARLITFAAVTFEGIVYSREGRIVDCNEQLAHILGYTVAELLGREIADLVAPEDLDRVMANIRLGHRSEIEHAMIRKDGSRMIVEAHGRPDTDGPRGTRMTVLRDITERKRMEDELRKSRNELELRVQERTAELKKAVDSLHDEIEERIAAQEIIKEQADILDSLFKDTLTPLVLLDPDFNFVRVNEAYALACQRETSDFEGHNHFEFYPHEENEAIFRKVVESKFPYQAIAKPFVFPDHPEWGVTYWDWTLTPLLDEHGEVKFLLFALNDVTERKKKEEQIDFTGKLLELFVTKPTRKEYLDSSIDLFREWTGCECMGIRVLDKQGNIPYESYKGFSQEFWEAENWLSVKNHTCACARVILQKPEHQDASMMSPGGSFYCNNTAGFAASLTEKELSRFRGLCIRIGFKSIAIIPIRYKETVLGALHIADRREGMVSLEKVQFIESVTPVMGEAIFRFSAEQALAKSEERYRMVVETMNEGLVMDDENGLLVYANDRLCEMLGYPPEEIIGHQVSNFFDEKNRELRKNQIELRKAGENEPYRLEWIRKDGQKIVTVVSPKGIFDDEGNYRGSFAVITDITERLKLESIAEAVNTMENIGFVFSGIRHEIGNPVNSIKMALSVLKQNIDTYSKEKIMEYAERMLEETSRIEYLLKAMKNFNMYETVELKDTYVTDFMNKFLSLVKNDLERKEIKVEISVLEPAWVYADPRALQQVLLNIVANAADALEGREDPRISISVLRMADMVNIRVEDNGWGMLEQQQEDLFKPFYTNKAKGTGLGLVISKKMMAKMKGFIEVVSEKNKGTIVDLFLPEGISE